MNPLADILSGMRVLVVEDELIVVLLVEDALADHQCVIVGPAKTLAEAIAFVNAGAFDAAVLDVNLAGEKIYPVAELLDTRNIPFLLISGYGPSAIPANRPNWRVCPKPFKSREMAAMLALQVAAHRN